MYTVLQYPGGDVVFGPESSRKALSFVLDKLKEAAGTVVEFPPRDLKESWEIRCGVRSVLRTIQHSIAPNYHVWTGRERQQLQRLLGLHLRNDSKTLPRLQAGPLMLDTATGGSYRAEFLCGAFLAEVKPDGDKWVGSITRSSCCYSETVKRTTPFGDKYMAAESLGLILRDLLREERGELEPLLEWAMA